MGTFIGHVVPSLAFTLLGLWHTINTTKSYKLHGPSNFTSAAWFPFPKIRRLELYLLLVFSLLAIAFNLLDDHHHGHHPLFSSLEHASMFLHLVIFAAAAFAADLSPSPEAWASLVGALSASAFGQELFLLRFHSADHAGLEGHYHWLLQVIVAASFAATVASVGMPSSFVAAIIRSATITCQGLWLAVMGCVLWVPRLLPEGCYASAASAADRLGAVQCPTEDAARRVAAVANLQFSWMVAGVSILTTYLSLRPEGKRMEYRQLQPRGGSGGESDESLKQGHSSV
ncbi:uncharacterized protein M6B38_376430 [Iris pallida]|uniref:Transmembrane protein 45B n=1 Tax=Iris pallida TaxID=29817 RepID=A0AAX6GB19_IRIPA|nr:uncharacterized protein M6B38_376430 [Iris pallida]